MLTALPIARRIDRLEVAIIETGLPTARTSVSPVVAAMLINTSLTFAAARLSDVNTAIATGLPADFANVNTLEQERPTGLAMVLTLVSAVAHATDTGLPTERESGSAVDSAIANGFAAVLTSASDVATMTAGIGFAIARDWVNAVELDMPMLLATERATVRAVVQTGASRLPAVFSRERDVAQLTLTAWL